ncbi:MAG: acyl-CoA reductase [Bacteroidota bacterium]
MKKTINQIIPEIKNIYPKELLAFANKEYTISVFDKLVIDFFNAISKLILRNSEINSNPALVALGFWLRKGNIDSIAKENEFLLNSKKFKLQPRGIVFHICPANVDTMFLYSLAISLLTGNKNILRLSSKLENNDTTILFNIIRDLINSHEFIGLKEYLNIVKYEHDEEISSYLSENADARIIWGGDNTVNIFKKIKTKNRSKDIFFPNRVSYSVFKAQAFLSIDVEEKKNIVKKFYNDSYVFDQKGCSSPQLIFIKGIPEDCSCFKDELYRLLVEYSSSNYKNDISSLASFKYSNLINDVVVENMHIQNVIKKNNYLYFVEIENESLQLNSCGAGYFYLKNIKDFSEITSFITTTVQTLTYFGLDSNEIESICKNTYGKGIDRIVPIGQALSFEYIWDGYNLLEELCLRRRII